MQEMQSLPQSFVLIVQNWGCSHAFGDNFVAPSNIGYDEARTKLFHK